ncbi:hypothetical protein FJ251_01260 [bacterium]|nr:hypothetical protein [bacterium]
MRRLRALAPWLALAALLARAPGLAAAPLPAVQVESEAPDSALAAELGRLTEAFLRALPVSERPVDTSPIRLLIAADGEQFSRLAGGRNPEWAAALVLERGRTVLIDKRHLLDLGRSAVLLRHELAHLLLDRRTRGAALPRWFHEGYAQLRAGEWSMEALWRLGRAAWTGSAIPLAQLERAFPATGPRAELAYAQSLAAVQALARDGEGWAALFEALEAGVPFADALECSRGERPSAFYIRFDGEVMPGFRRWSLLFGTAPLFFGLALLFIVAAWRRRRQRGAGVAAAESAEAPQGETEQSEWLNRGWIDRFRRR